MSWPVAVMGQPFPSGAASPDRAALTVLKLACFQEGRFVAEGIIVAIVPKRFCIWAEKRNAFSKWGPVLTPPPAVHDRGGTRQRPSPHIHSYLFPESRFAKIFSYLFSLICS
jgi:hypothetical protein